MKQLDKKGWKIVRFGDVCRNLNVTVKSPEENGYDKVIGLENIESGSLHIKTWGDIAEGTTFTKTFEPGHVLFGKRRAYLKKAAVAKFKGLCSGDILVFEAISKVLHPKLLPFIVSSDRFFEHAVKTSAGSLSPRTKFQDLANFEFSLPPINQQEKLAELLWAGDELIQKRKSILQKVEDLYEASLNKYYNKEFVKNKTHDIVKLEQICEISGGSTPSRVNEIYWGGSIPWLTPTDVTNQSEIEISSTKEYITESGLKAISNKLYPPDSVLYCSRATIGAAVVNKVPMATNQGFTNFICNESIKPLYLYFYLQFLKSDLTKLAGGSTFPEISKSSFKKFKINLVSPEIQDKVIGVIQSIINNKTLVKNNLDLIKITQEKLISSIIS